MSARLSLLACLLMASSVALAAGGGEAPRDISHVTAPAAPASQSVADAQRKTAGCLRCHLTTDAPSMHLSESVVLGCTDCHGGDATPRPDAEYVDALRQAHVQARYPKTWGEHGSGNPERSYVLLNKEAPEYTRFVNPGDYRVAREACGACHLDIIRASERSLMSNAAMFWGGAAYNNGILPFKHSILGEAYTRDGEAAMIEGIPLDDPEAAKFERMILPALYPMPAWETVKPGDVFRVFERGGRNILNLFPETGLPNSLGLLQRLEEPGRPDIRQSNRGAGTGGRVAIPVLNIHKSRLNDPFAWFLGTNDQPGDYRSSGCSACHVIYANDRDPRHSGPWAEFGHRGETATADPTIPRGQSGHPIRHEFSRAIPSSQCMICHMHQPNMFINTFLGYTMWDYESDAPFMWPEKQQYPDDHSIREVNDRNPEGAAPRGKWADLDFLEQVSEMNPKLNDTQFADYHGHGWNFRAVFKRDRKGNLLDGEGAIVSNDDPEKFDKAVHMSSIHVDVGMHCVDCHYAQDAHGDGHLYGEVAAAVEIRCKDCHGTAQAYPDLRTSGPAAPQGGNDIGLIRNPDGKRRFAWRDGALYQRSVLNPDMEWKLSLVKDTVNPAHPGYNAKAARAKLMRRNLPGKPTSQWKPGKAGGELAHQDEEVECFACHSSWTNSCGGCHLPIEANWKTSRHKYEGGETRNFATYNPQVLRDQMYMLGKHGNVKNNTVAPVRSSSALVLSSRNANREIIYAQQPPVAASGYSSQAMNPHFPHTVRKTETRVCSDCHLSSANDNNAILANTLGLGTRFMDFVGLNAWLGTGDSVTAVQVTEWEEPQAVIGSYLHRYAYPDWFAGHETRGRKLDTAHDHRSPPIGCLQLRGEYLFAAAGSDGLRVFDVASIANKAYSQRIISGPFSPLGHDTRVPSPDASCLALATTQPVIPARNEGVLMREVNAEQPMHPIYRYAAVSDRVEGLILVNIDTLSDGEPRNNFLTRALSFNPDGLLTGARHIILGGTYAYVLADRGLVILNLDEPLQPQLVAVHPLQGGRASALQFRYLFVTDDSGLRLFDVTVPEKSHEVAQAHLPISDARGLHLARTWAYVASGAEGLSIIDIENPERPKLLTRFDAAGSLDDATDVIVATTNASLYAYVADGRNGLKVVQLTSPSSQPNFYGYSPEPKPELIAWYPTGAPALSLSRPLERDRAVDETGHQVAVFGRLGARPFNLQEMRALYLNEKLEIWTVSDDE